ncbi:MAG: hypothetical protein ACW98Y_05340 [Candidatus Thorarchaeota archaeon]|jgi:hypothetical protein
MEFTHITWPNACWGCGTEDNLIVEERQIGRTLTQTKKVGSSGMFDKYQTSILASFRTPATISLCSDCKNYAELEQKTVRQYSLFAILLSAIVAIATILIFAPQVDVVFNDIITTYLLLIPATIWVPLYFASKYLSYSGAIAYQSYYNIDFDENKDPRLYFRNRTFYDKFRELNKGLLAVIHKPGTNVAKRSSEEGWQEKLRNCTTVTCGIGGLAYLCCIMPFFVLGILQLIRPGAQDATGFIPIGLAILTVFVIGYLIQGPVFKAKYREIAMQYPGAAEDVKKEIVKHWKK